MRLASFYQALNQFIRRWPLLFALCATVLFYGFWLTNQGTPSGDGNRVLLQVDFIETSGSLLPFWDFQRVGGMPTFADPERFIWLSWLIDASKPTSNLQLNLAFVATGLLIAAAIYFLSRQLKLSPFLSAMVAVALVTSQDILVNFWTGRINPLLSIGIIFLGMGCLVRCIQSGFSPLWFAASAVTVAVALAYNGPYALFFPCIPLFALAWAACRERESDPRRALLLAVLTTGALGFAGACLSAPWFIPLFLAHMDVGLSSTSGLKWDYPALSTLPGLLVPLSLDAKLAVKQNIPLLAPLVCGGILIVALRRRLIPNEPYAIAFAGLIVVALLGLIIGAVPPLREFARELPIIGMIRQSLTFSSIFTFGAVYLAALLTRALASETKPDLVRSKALLLCIVLVVGVSYLANASLLLAGPTLLTVAVVLFAALVVAIAWIGAAKLNGHRNEALFGILVAVGVLSMLPSAVTPPLQPNAMSPEALATALKADTSYHRAFCYKRREKRDCRVPGVPLENLAGFSHYFLPAHHRFLELLLGREITRKRPHWVKDFSCEEQHPTLLDLANVKYVLCHDDDTLTGSSSVVAQHGGRSLLKREQWRSALRVYDVSELERDFGKNTPLETREHVIDALSRGTVILDAGHATERDSGLGSEPAQTTRMESLSANKLQALVESDRPGILVIPEYWAPGWSATLNGQSVPLRRAFYMYRAVEVPAGESVVVLTYWPPGLTLGLIIGGSMAFLLGSAVFIANPARRRRLRRTA